MVTYHIFCFQCKWQKEAIMPPYWGSALRGGMGKWLKKISCILRSRTCDHCTVRASCAYGFIFETEHLSNTGSKNAHSRPHPIVLKLPYPCNFGTDKGDGFEFSILLMDKAVDYFPHLLYSLIKLGQQDGLGARAHQGLGRFQVDKVTCNGELVFERQAAEVKKPAFCKKLELHPEENGVKRFRLEFATPFRVKHQGRFVQQVPFHLLIRAALRRISSLEFHYGQGEPQLDYRGLVQEAEKVKTVREDVTWREVPRYSSRQKSKMTIGGVVGSATYEGELGKFLPLLRYCEVVHLGKQTFFGLGKVRIEV